SYSPQLARTFPAVVGFPEPVDPTPCVRDKPILSRRPVPLRRKVEIALHTHGRRLVNVFTNSTGANAEVVVLVRLRHGRQDGVGLGAPPGPGERLALPEDQAPLCDLVVHEGAVLLPDRR